MVEKQQDNRRRGSTKAWELDKLAADRKITRDSTVRMLSPERNERIVYHGDIPTNENVEPKRGYLIPKARLEEISKGTRRADLASS